MRALKHLSICLSLMILAVSARPTIGADSACGQEGKYRVCYGNRFGFIDKSGKTILKPTYLGISDFHEGLASFRQGNREGVLDAAGHVKIKPSFAAIGEYRNGHALARTLTPRERHPITGEWECAGLWGLIDKHGKWLVKPIYDHIYGPDKGYYIVTKNGKRGFVDNNLKVLLPPSFDELREISGGLAAFGAKGKLGFVNISGQIIVPAKFKSVGPFKEGLAKVLNADGWGFIDTNGTTAIKHQYKTASSFSHGLALVSTFEDPYKVFFIKHDGSRLGNTEYSFARPFKTGKARVHLQTGGTSSRGYIDTSGNFTAEEQDDEYARLSNDKVSEGLRIVKDDASLNRSEMMSTCDYVVQEENGRELFRLPKIYTINEFHEGLAIFSQPVLISQELSKPNSEKAEEHRKFPANPYSTGDWRRRILGEKRRWGYKDKTGKIVISPKFRFAAPFSDGLAIVEERLTVGYIDKTGKYAIKPQFPIAVSSFNGGIACGSKCSKEFSAKPFYTGGGCIQNTNCFRIGLINRHGKFITPAVYEEFKPPSEGLLAFRLNDKWGFMNEAGKVVIEPQYAAVQSFSEGFAAVTQRTGAGGLTRVVPAACGFVGKDGKVSIPYTYTSAHSFKNGLALVTENCHNISGKPEGFVDKSGKLQIPSDLHLSQSFEDGVAVRGNENKKWLIDPSGKALTDDSYDEFGVEEDKVHRLVGEGLIPVRKGLSWGFVDKTGSCVAPPTFNKVGHFHEGLAVVKFNHGHLAYIDRQGKIVLDENYEEATPFQDGMAIITNAQGRFVINKEGKHLFDASGIEDYSEGLFVWRDLSKEPRKYFYDYQYD